MIIRCSEKNRDEILEYVNQNVVMNLFIIGDIENYGFDNQFQTVFVDKEYDKIKTVYLVYHNNLVIGSLMGLVDQSFVEKLVNEYQIKDINGDLRIIEQLDLPDFKLDRCKIAMLDHLKQEVIASAVELNSEDLSEYAKSCEAIFDRKIDLNQISEEYHSQAAHYYGCKIEGKLISGARTSAECAQAAMIVGVYTLEEYRNQGYGKATVSKLCLDLLALNKKPCLFYNDPYATKLYRKLGFKDYGDYGLLRFK